MKSVTLLSLVVLLLLSCCRGTLQRTVRPPSREACTFDVGNVLKHLQVLDNIATLNGGNRAAGTTGYDASVGYILDQLQETNYKVELQDFPIVTFSIIGTPSLVQSAPVSETFTYLIDFKVFSGSGSGTVSAPVTKVSSLGCSSSDYDNFPNGNIALISRGTCTFQSKVDLATTAGASAVIIYNSAGEGVFSGTVNSDLPIFSTSEVVGLELSSPQVELTISVETLKEETITTNIIADTLDGDPSRIIVVGSHLDGVTDGAGINDNGSGSATNLEMALTLYRCLQPKNKIRFAWWAAEELGLLGSTYYVNDLVNNNPDELKNIWFNINIDMLGSPNFFYGIYNGSGAAPAIREQCIKIQNEFENFFDGLSKPYGLTSFDGRSDYGPFIEVGIPAGGLFSGAEQIKDATGRKLYGGLANTPFDPCYHAYCDSYDNISEEGLTTFSNAAFHVTAAFANNEVRLPHTHNHPFSSASHTPLFTYQQHPDAIARY